MVYVMIKMGGKGVRFGAEIPKQFLGIYDRPLFCYLLEQYESLNCIDGYIIVTNKDYVDFTTEKAKEVLGEKLLEVTVGGETGGGSIYNGIMCAKSYLNDGDILLMHDATDPILAKEKIDELIQAAKTYVFASIYSEQVRVIYQKTEDDFVEGNYQKNSVGSGYSPEAFRFRAVYDLFKLASEEEYANIPSVASLAVTKGYRPKLILSHTLPLKITYPEDFDVLKKIVGE